MKVFISWSGALSREVAQVFYKQLRLIIQATEPFMSDEIEKGFQWSRGLVHALRESEVGIICLTSENLNSPWLHFEAGALATRIEEARVIPFLVNVDRAVVTGPLGLFQSTLFDKDDVFRMMVAINNAFGEDSLPHEVLRSSFDNWWPRFECEVQKVLDIYQLLPFDSEEESNDVRRSDREILDEVLEITRNLQRGNPTRDERRGGTSYSLPTKLWSRVGTVFQNVGDEEIPIAKVGATAYEMTEITNAESGDGSFRSVSSSTFYPGEILLLDGAPLPVSVKFTLHVEGYEPVQFKALSAIDRESRQKIEFECEPGSKS